MPTEVFVHCTSRKGGGSPTFTVTPTETCEGAGQSQGRWLEAVSSSTPLSARGAPVSPTFSILVLGAL